MVMRAGMASQIPSLCYEFPGCCQGAIAWQLGKRSGTKWSMSDLLAGWGFRACSARHAR